MLSPPTAIPSGSTPTTSLDGLLPVAAVLRLPELLAGRPEEVGSEEPAPEPMDKEAPAPVDVLVKVVDSGAAEAAPPGVGTEAVGEVTEPPPTGVVTEAVGGVTEPPPTGVVTEAVGGVTEPPPTGVVTEAVGGVTEPPPTGVVTEPVGGVTVGLAAVGLAVQLAGLVMRLVSNVTAPFRARARPGMMSAPVVRLMLVRASRFP
jgi:hypothetical protein